MTNSFLQTKDWTEFQESLGREVLEYDQNGIKARIIRHDLPFKKSYLYIPHGPEMDFNSMTGGFKNPVSNFINWLKDSAMSADGRKSIFIKIEPLNDLIAQTFAERKFKRSKKEIQPAKTVIVDLEGDENQLLERMDHKARYNIRVAEKTNLKFSEGDVEEFWCLMKKTTERQSFSSHPKEYYQKLVSFFARGREITAKIFFVRLDGRPLAAAIILFFGDTAYYVHGGSDYEGQKFRPAYKLHWSIIKWLKSKGYKYYDLWGVDSKKWPGVTKFKMYWGGRLVERPGSFDLPISKLWYMLYKSYRNIFRKEA
jgi:lipid II:glycine glycyltransferase (peptidoglycan interpeptide bridge formation enzyme)